jgi:hypothetical protein
MFYLVSLLEHPGMVGDFVYAADLTGDGREELLYIRPGTQLAEGQRPEIIDFGDEGEEGSEDDEGGAFEQEAAFRIDPAGGITALEDFIPQEKNPYTGSVLTLGDFDLNGSFDLYLCRMAPPPDGRKRSANEVGKLVEPGWHDRFLSRQGKDFVDQTSTAGFKAESRSQAAMTVDIDGDGDLDLLVGTDGFVKDHIYINDGQGNFSDRVDEMGLSVPTDAMGFDAADVNGDGIMDLYISDNVRSQNLIEGNDDMVRGHRLFLGQGNGKYVLTPIDPGMPLTKEFVGWGVGLHDMDNDGDVDLFVVNGEEAVENIPKEQLGFYGGQINLLYLNDGKGEFSLVPAPEGSGLNVALSSRAAVFSDIDHDGDLDVLISNLDRPPTLLRNEMGGDNHWLQIRLDDPVYKPAIGAIVSLTAAGNQQKRWVKGTPSYGGSSTRWIHFGLGQDKEATELTIRWPDGSSQFVGTVAADQFLTIKKP